MFVQVKKVRSSDTDYSHAARPVFSLTQNKMAASSLTIDFQCLYPVEGLGTQISNSFTTDRCVYWYLCLPLHAIGVKSLVKGSLFTNSYTTEQNDE